MSQNQSGNPGGVGAGPGGSSVGAGSGAGAGAGPGSAAGAGPGPGALLANIIHKSITHLDPARKKLIDAMDKDDKSLENSAIEIRNKKREKRRRDLASLLATNPGATQVPISDDESLITVSSGHGKQRSPGSSFVNGLKKIFSPILRVAKRSNDDPDESRDDRLKRLRGDFEPEVDMIVGDVFNLEYSDEILELEAEREYIPLTLFTVHGREALHDRLHDVRRKAINARKKGEPKKMLVDVNHTLFGKEEDLGERDWNQAAEEMVEWAKTAKKGPELGERLGEHFAWLKAKLSGAGPISFSQIPFGAVLKTDIELRRLYRHTPFLFNPSFYQSTLDKHYNAIQATTLLSEVASLRSQLSSLANPSSTSLGSAMSIDPPAGPSNSSGRGGFFRGRGRFLSSSLFRGGQTDKASGAVCLICAVRGHRIDACKSTVFADGSPIKAKLVGGDLIQIANNQIICIFFNVQGPEKCKKHSSSKPAEHACSFCLSKDHHAFSWKCRSAPPRDL